MKTSLLKAAFDIAAKEEQEVSDLSIITGTEAHEVLGLLPVTEKTANLEWLRVEFDNRTAYVPGTEDNLPSYVTYKD